MIQLSDDLDRLLRDLEQGTAATKVRSATELGRQAATPRLLIALDACLTSRDWHLRAAAATSLAKVKGRDALPQLLPLLEDKAFGVREDVRKVVEALESGRDP